MISWLGFNIDFSGWMTNPNSFNKLKVSRILFMQDSYASPWRYMNHQHKLQSYDPNFSNVRLVFGNLINLVI